MLGREADEGGLEHYARSGLSIKNIAESLQGSDEYRFQNSKIKKVHQICITDNNKIDLSNDILNRTQTVKKYTPGHEYRLWDNNSLREFIKTNFEPDVLCAYDTLLPYAYKADLAKLCILYKLGGWIFDLGVELVNPVKVPEHCSAVFFKDVQSVHDTFSHCTIAYNAMYSEPGKIFLLRAIEKIVDHCETLYYGFTPIDISGPNMLGRILAMFDHAQQLPNGDIVPTTHFGRYTLHPPSNSLFDGYVICKAKGSLPITDLNPNMNFYPDYWQSKSVYKIKHKTMILNNQPKTFVIALKDHPISLSQLNDCLVSAKEYDWDVEIFWGTNGNTLSLDSWKEIGVTPLLHKGSMNKLGMWGCFFSHFALWNKCVELNEPIIVLEHDAVIQSVWNPIEISKSLIKLHEHYFFPDPTNWTDPDSGKSSSSTHAYCITPDHANKLIHFAKTVGGYSPDRMMGDKVLPISYWGAPSLVSRQNTYSTSENL